jgi:hypothetical protein
MAVGDPIKDLLPAMILLVLIVASWYFRPVNRKVGLNDTH